MSSFERPPAHVETLETMAKSSRIVARRVALASAGLVFSMALGFALWLLTEARQPGSRVELLPLNQWFSSGLTADGPHSVTIQNIYGPISIKRTYPR